MLTPVKKQYPHDIDPEVVDLCDAINCIPGIRTDSSCCGHGKCPMHIYIVPTDSDNLWMGLFFIGRCTDKRYWKYGQEWTLEIEVGDIKKPEGPPVSICLQGKSVGKESYTEAASLVKNIVHHLNHKNFIKGYNIDLSQFDIEGKNSETTGGNK